MIILSVLITPRIPKSIKSLYIELKNMDLIQEIEQKLNLTFLEQEPQENLCFATKNAELRQDYKLFFTKTDVHFFVQSFGTTTVQIPESADLFWECVQKGKAVF